MCPVDSSVGRYLGTTDFLLHAGDSFLLFTVYVHVNVVANTPAEVL